MTLVTTVATVQIFLRKIFVSGTSFTNLTQSVMTA